MERPMTSWKTDCNSDLLDASVDTQAACPPIVGSSEEIEQVRRMIARLCIARAPVLILGETGVGKELVARSLHASAPWHVQPFVAIDSGALPAAIAESELFGYERGAFTGASQPRTGLLVAAGSGTI